MKSLVVLAYAAVTDTVVHAAAGVIMTWGLLTPAACLGAAAWRRNALARSMTIFLAPGMASFLLYYFSDGPYLAYRPDPRISPANGGDPDARLNQSACPVAYSCGPMVGRASSITEYGTGPCACRKSSRREDYSNSDGGAHSPAPISATCCATRAHASRPALLADSAGFSI
jgi:hypothetical protein